MIAPRRHDLAYAAGAGPLLYSAFGQSEVSMIYTQLNQYYVVLEVAPQYWQIPRGSNYIYPATSSAGNAPLAPSPAATQHTPHRSQVNHTRLFPSVTVSFNLATGISLSDATREIPQMQHRLDMPKSFAAFSPARRRLIRPRLAVNSSW